MSGLRCRDCIVGLHSQDCIVGIALSRLHRRDCIVGIALSRLHRRNCIVGIASSELHRQGCLVGIASSDCIVGLHRQDFIIGIASYRLHRRIASSGLHYWDCIVGLHRRIASSDCIIGLHRQIGAYQTASSTELYTSWIVPSRLNCTIEPRRDLPQSAMSNVTPNYSTSGEEEVNRNYKLIIDVYTVGFLCLFGIMGYAISMAVLGRDRSIRRTTGFLLQMLALSDTAFLVTCLFYQSLNTIAKTTDWLPNDARRHWPYYIEPYIWPVASIAQTCTVWLVVVVTADRYVAICKPLQSPQYSTMSRVRAMVGAVWVFAVLYNLPRFFERDIVKVVDPVTSETSYVVVKSAIRNNPIYILVYMTGSFFVARFFVPFAALAFFNTRLIQAIRESNEIQVKSCSRGGGGGKVGGTSCALISTAGGRRTSGSVKLHPVSSNGRSNCLRVKERYTLTLVVVVFVFVICAMPDLLLRFWASLNAYFPSVPFPMPAPQVRQRSQQHVPDDQLVRQLSHLLLRRSSFPSHPRPGDLLSGLIQARKSHGQLQQQQVLPPASVSTTLQQVAQHKER